jgi:hypothetical protein
MASTAASAGENSERRQDATLNETSLPASGPILPELSAGTSEKVCHGVLNRRILVIVENQAVPFDGVFGGRPVRFERTVTT